MMEIIEPLILLKGIGFVVKAVSAHVKDCPIYADIHQDHKVYKNSGKFLAAHFSCKKEEGKYYPDSSGI